MSNQSVQYSHQYFVLPIKAFQKLKSSDCVQFSVKNEKPYLKNYELLTKAIACLVVCGMLQNYILHVDCRLWEFSRQGSKSRRKCTKWGCIYLCSGRNLPLQHTTCLSGVLPLALSATQSVSQRLFLFLRLGCGRPKEGPSDSLASHHRANNTRKTSAILVICRCETDNANRPRFCVSVQFFN